MYIDIVQNKQKPIIIIKMSAVRSRKSNNIKNKRLFKLTKQIKLPFGKSHIDYLPDDVLYHVYYLKHQLEFKSTLNIISKLRIAVDSEIVETRIPIRKLLETATSRKQIYIDVIPFNSPDDFTKGFKIQEEFNAKLDLHRGIGAFRQLEIKFKEKVQLMIIDVLYIIFHLGFTRRLNRILVDIEADDIHSRTSCISFTMK